MATPPPEAAVVMNDQKPQLPLSTNGVTVDTEPKVAPETKVTEIKALSPETQTPTFTESIHLTVNGHSHNDQPSAVNGINTATTASPPRSPKLTPDELSLLPVPPTNNATQSQPDPVATTDQSQIHNEAEATVPQPSPLPASIGETSAVANTEMKDSDDTQQMAAQPVPEPAEVSPAPASQQNGAEAAQTAPTAALTTDLPHHPSGIVEPSSTPADNASTEVPPPLQSVPPLQPVDQEMKDAPETPVSPTKLAREREADGNEEPAAKRTKIEGEATEAADFKVPPLPTPVAETPRPVSSEQDGAITKMQHKFLLKNIQGLKRVHDSRFFREPVDPVKLNIPHYPTMIPHPMDLGTMEKKLKANEYPTVKAVVDDFILMVQNAVTFNGPDHIVSTEGKNLKSIFDKQMANLPKPDEIEEKKIKKPSPKTQASLREPRSTASTGAARANASSPQATTFALGPEGLPLIRRDSTNADGRPKRSIHPPKRDLPYSTKPKKKKYQWELRFCQEVLEELHRQKHYAYAFPFYYPVDPVALNIPNYHSIIKKPMDLSTMQMKLKTGQYENAKEFEMDMRQIFKNCFKFNIAGDPTYVAGQQLEAVFNNKWAQKARYLEAHEPHPEHHSAESSDEVSEVSEEESDDDERLTLLQKQIAEMSRQVEAITQKKKKTPPSSKKAGRSKSGKKESKKGGAVGVSKKDRRGSKAAKPEKQRYVTYHEKQIISNGISSLTDKKMQEALKIIQNNVPSLKGTQETEIELDIDELPNDVLLMLLKFVKKNVPNIADDEDAAAPVTNAVPAKPKKNKPMSKSEQEAQISMLQSNLNRFQGGGQSPDPMPSVEANDSSDEDDDSEESEEE